MSNSTPSMRYDSAAPRNRLLSEIRELYQYRDLILQLTIRNITVRYKRSTLGILWTMLDPLLTMIVMAFVFTALLRRQVPHFPIYLLTGLTVWNYFAQATTSAMHDFVTSERLVSKVYLPQSTFVIVASTTALVNFLFSLVSLVLIALFTAVPLSLYSLTLIIPLAILTAFNLGIGLILAPLEALYSDISNIYGIFLRLLIYLSAIFYPIDILPGWLQTVVKINPVYQFIDIFRNPIYRGTPIPLDSLVYTAILSVVLLIVGAAFFTRVSDDVAMML